MNRKSNFAVIGYLLLVFVAGAVIGGFADRLYMSSPGHARSGPDEYRRKLVADLKKRLDLRPAQVTQLNAILDATGARFHEIHNKLEPDIAALRREHDAQVRAILDDSQRAEYDKWRAERDKQHTAEKH